ncbi:acetyltransferase (GNAT) family domain-containing protein [Phthorimaea operculella]|nr:acetyltransferase (GNAT) family domain-containing protein [Phthorimaea operculella]
MTHIHRMIHELAEYEGVPDGPRLTVQDLIEGGGGGEALAGYALCNRAYSSWTRRALYVEDLYVRPDLRGHGIGTQLLARLCQMGVDDVLESNTSARGFYAGLGARCLRETEGRAALRLDQPHIERLAARAPPRN